MTPAIPQDEGYTYKLHPGISRTKEDYGLKVKGSTTHNPQSNAILERIHQVIGNMIRTYELEKIYMDKQDPWSGIIAATCFGIRSTYHTTLQATPGQLVFGRDTSKHEANWHAIKQRKQKVISQNNERENAKRIAHTYTAGDKILLTKHNARKLKCPNEGPYKITEVHNNGTVTIEMNKGKGKIYERVNIRRIYPYHE